MKLKGEAARRMASILIMFACAMGPLTALAQGDAEFYRGKTITVGIPSDAGGGYDSHGRLFANYLSRHIPGNPTIVAQNQGAGAGLVLANNLFNTAPKDGTSIALMRASVLYEELYGNSAVRFKAREFNWLGNMNSGQDTCVFWSGRGVANPEDFFAREHVIGADGVAGMDYSFPKIYNEILGAKFKIVTGYKGTPDRILAMERGEIEGACGVTTSQIKTLLMDQVNSGRIKIIAQAGLTSDPAFKNAPNMLTLAKTAEQRNALEFLFAQLKLSRPVAAPPGIPPERVAVLRRAFDAIVKDPEFLAEAGRQRLDVDPTNGGETAATVEGFHAIPQGTVDHVRAALAPQANR